MQKLIKDIWEKEELPEDWQVGLICALHKKGDKLNCVNYRGITLQNTAFKIITNKNYISGYDLMQKL